MSLAAKVPTYDDICALPAGVTGQLVLGTLHAHPRPAMPHALAASALGEELGPPFKRGRHGPGGWILLDEPEVHLGGDVLVPDLAGWRRERLPEVPEAPYLTLAPDWVCEVLSPSTAALDRGDKRKVYQREGVPWFWIVDPKDRTLEVLALDGPSYRVVDVFSGEEKVRVRPFDAIELDLAVLWAR
ncbi:MAG: Uma2 family endonuclease [Myxococcales bacterium]|jgi:Uma2 family endonuclease|nr:Uma2 family endonuclease [Myxococcales bacterium]